MHHSRQLNCWSLRCSWSIACQRCSNYIFVLDLTHGFHGLGKENCKTRRKSFKFWDLVLPILEILRYLICRWYLTFTLTHWPWAKLVIFCRFHFKKDFLISNIWNMILVQLEYLDMGAHELKFLEKYVFMKRLCPAELASNVSDTHDMDKTSNTQVPLCGESHYKTHQIPTWMILVSSCDCLCPIH